MKICTKKQICNVCQAPFKMERGCNLEKRCPACRLLGLARMDKDYIYDRDRHLKRIEKNPNQINNSGVYVCPNGNNRALYLADETPIYDRLIHNLKEELSYVDNTVDMEELRGKIYEAIDKLNDRQKRIIELRFGLENNSECGDTLQEIGDYLGISRERVRIIESSAIKELKHPRVGLKLKIYIEE